MQVVLAFFLVFFLLSTQDVGAIFYNDTQIIEIGDGVPPPPPPLGPEYGGTAIGGSGNTTPGSQNGSNDEDEDGVSESPTGETGVDANVSGETSTVVGGTQQESENAVINLLVSAGALSGSIGGTNSNSGIESGAIGGVIGEGGSGITGRIIIRGERVRQSLRDAFELKDFLTFWQRGSSSTGGATYYGLIAASTAVRDINVQDIAFTSTTFEITYRSRGYILGFIPKSFPVRIIIVPAATSASERVVIRLPWYRFFIRKFFSTPTLTADIDTVVREAAAGVDGDVNPIVFEAVAAYLKKKVGTISDSVLLGTIGS